jgi:hypothetical protein
MDTFYPFLGFVVVISLEMFAAYSWLGAYYRFGLPVNFTRRQLPPDAAAPLAAAPGALISGLVERFKSHPSYPTIQWKVISPPGKGRVDIALHEALFEPRRGFRYLPVMHSLARLDPAAGAVKVTGYISWYVLYILAYLAYSTTIDQTFIPVALLVIVIFVVSYFTQASINRMVAVEIASLLAPGSAQEAGA